MSVVAHIIKVMLRKLTLHFFCFPKENSRNRWRKIVHMYRRKGKNDDSHYVIQL